MKKNGGLRPLSRGNPPQLKPEQNMLMFPWFCVFLPTIYSLVPVSPENLYVCIDRSGIYIYIKIYNIYPQIPSNQLRNTNWFLYYHLLGRSRSDTSSSSHLIADCQLLQMFPPKMWGQGPVGRFSLPHKHPSYLTPHHWRP